MLTDIRFNTMGFAGVQSKSMYFILITISHSSVVHQAFSHNRSVHEGKPARQVTTLMVRYTCGGYLLLASKLPGQVHKGEARGKKYEFPLLGKYAFKNLFLSTPQEHRSPTNFIKLN